MSIHNRILAYSGSLTLHSFNALAMGYSLNFGETMQNPDADLILLKNMTFRYITIWNLIFHIGYAALSLCCELYDVMDVKIYQHHRKTVQKIRDVFFCSLLWPVSVTIFAIFWSFYIYDRELVFPTYIDKVFSQLSNHAMHTSILVFVLWEAAHNPRETGNHWSNFKLYSGLFFSYITTMFYSYYQFGAYPYPVLILFSNTQLAVFLTFIYLMLNIGYLSQWYLTPLLKKYVETRRNKKMW